MSTIPVRFLHSYIDIFGNKLDFEAVFGGKIRENHELKLGRKAFDVRRHPAIRISFFIASAISRYTLE